VPARAVVCNRPEGVAYRGGGGGGGGAESKKNHRARALDQTRSAAIFFFISVQTANMNSDLKIREGHNHLVLSHSLVFVLYDALRPVAL
jgi:hypothetical protein